LLAHELLPLKPGRERPIWNVVPKRKLAVLQPCVCRCPGTGRRARERHIEDMRKSIGAAVAVNDAARPLAGD